MKRKISTIVMVAFLVTLVACKGKEQEKSGSEVSEPKKETAQMGQEKTKVPPPVNHELAEKGEEVFKTKGCSGCHTIGQGKRTGPDLAGVTKRRSLEWIQNWVLHPDVMVEKDPIAKELLATYLVKMPNQNLTQEQAQAVIMYLREKDSEVKEGSEHKEQK
jgi:mono/diheme cytochrome c family protein